MKIINALISNRRYISPNTNTMSGKVVIVTGNTGKIGSAIEEVLIKNGAIVIGASLSTKNNNVDITNEDQVKKLISKVFQKYRRIDAIVNNAGLFSYGNIEDVTEYEFDKVVNVNIKGTFLLSKHVTPIMKLQKSGTIINIGSKISRNTKIEPKKTLYALTKYAIEGFSFALNRELKQFGIRVICLIPGTVNTFLSRKFNQYMSPYDVAEIVKMILLMDQIDFEGIIFKSKRQNI